VIMIGQAERGQSRGAAPVGACHAIVLAGGQGRRLEQLTRQFEGRPVPKQFATFGSRTSLLQRTLQRILDLQVVTRTYVVVDASHARLAAQQVAESDTMHILLQPADRGTAAGVMFPLARVLREDPNATILLTPCDHAVGDENIYRRGIFKAFRAIACGVTEIVLFGVRADAPRTDYGWILPGRPLGAGVREVARFVEKPAAAKARQLHAEGALWSTMVVAARAQSLWDLFQRAAPELGVVFEAIKEMSEPNEGRFLRRKYESMPRLDFSRDILGAGHGVSVMSWPSRMAWSDLGTPDRLLEWLDREPVTPSASEVEGQWPSVKVSALKLGWGADLVHGQDRGHASPTPHFQE